MNKPNVVFLLADDQRYNTISALGNREISTPNFDRLAKMGISFTNAHIMGGTNGAVCMPSRATFNTGRPLFHLENEGQNISETHTTIGEAFKNAGYNTCGIGKWHNGIDSYARSFTNGANIFFGGMWDHWNVPVCDFHADGQYTNTIKYTSNFFYDNKTMTMHCDRISAGIHSSELMSNAAVDYINNYDSDAPFYLYTAFLAPHDPRTMPDKFKNMYGKEDITLPGNFAARHYIDFGVENVRDEVLADYPRGEDEIRRHIADYYGIISHLDDCAGRIIDALESSGRLENTIIVFTADNGLSVGSHGLMGKQNLYEESVRIPMILAGGGLPENKITDEYAFLFDLYPTLCELCGVEIPESVDTESLMPIIRGDGKVHDDLYLAYEKTVRSVKSGDYKLIEYRTDKIRETQLFNLKTDPTETNDLSGTADYRDILDSLKRKMLEFKTESGDESHRIGREFWKNY